MQNESVALYCKENGSDKVYQLALEQSNGGFVVNFAYGRRGSSLQTGTKTQAPVEFGKAKKIYDKLITEKTAKGYAVGENGAAYQSAQNGDKKDSGIRCQLLNPIEESEVSHYIADTAFWAQEKKNGERRLVRKVGDTVEGINKKGLLVDLPKAVVTSVLAITGDFVMDGEQIGEKVYVFDLLSIGGNDLKGESFAVRYLNLESLLRISKRNAVLLVPAATDAKEKTTLYALLQKEEKEGIVFKDSNAPYKSGRPNSGGTQVKFKFYDTLSAVVKKVNDKRSVAVVLLNDSGEFVDAGNVAVPPNAEIPAEGSVVEIRYLYALRESGILQQPTLLVNPTTRKAVRDDVSKEECKTAQLKYFVPEEDAA